MLNNDKPSFQRLINLALGIAVIDGGVVIALQIITFLCKYLGMQPIGAANKYHVLISIISMLNLAVIILRITWLTRGIKLDLVQCYKQAFQRWSSLFLLNILGVIILLGVLVPCIKLLTMLFPGTAIQPLKLITVMLTLLVPCGLMTWFFVLDQQKTPVQAIKATYNYLINQANARTLAILGLMYCVPFFIISMISSATLIPYLALISDVWYLFCHILTVIVYVSSAEQPIIPAKNDKITKVIII